MVFGKLSFPFGKGKFKAYFEWLLLLDLGSGKGFPFLEVVFFQFDEVETFHTTQNRYGHVLAKPSFTGQVGV